MGDSENVQQPSKGRGSLKQLSRENPDLDDDDDVSGELESGTFEKASDEVLASTTAPLPESKLAPATTTTLPASAAVGTNAPLSESKLTPATTTTLLASAAVGTNAPLPESELTPAETVVEDNQKPFDTEEGYEVDSKQVDASSSAAEEIEKCRDYQTLDPADWEIDTGRLVTGELIAAGADWNLHKGTYLRETVAIKSLKPERINTQTLKQLCEQANRMSELQHPNVVEFIGACIQPAKPCIVTEFFERKSIGTPSYKMIWLPKFLIKAARECAEGMEYLHEKEVIHGNLTANNLHRDQTNVVKVSDFWVSKVKTQPEVLLEDKPSDVFSYGSVISELMTPELLADLHPRRTYPKKLMELIQSCRSCDRDERPSFAQVVVSLKELEYELEEECRKEEACRKEEERRKEEEERRARHVPIPYCFGEKVFVMPTAKHQISVIWLHDCGGSGSKSRDFVRSLGLPHVKWVCPTAPLMASSHPQGPAYTQWYDCDGVVGSKWQRLKESEEYVAKLLKDEPEEVLKVVAGIGHGSRLALYFGVRWALGVHPIELGAVLGYNGLPLERHLLQKIGTIDGSSDRAKTLPVQFGYDLNPCHYQESFFQASAFVESFRDAGFARATLQDLSGNIEDLAKDVVYYLMNLQKTHNQGRR